MPASNWTIGGEYMESCNCDYLCPCIYTNPQGAATHEHCTAALVFRIDQGRRGDVDLGGLKFALILRSRRVMADGGWALGVVVDAAADAAQRRALGAIAGGEAGGTPAVIRQNLVRDFRGIEFKPIDFVIDGLRRAVSIPDMLAFEIRAVTPRNRATEPMYIDNTAHPASPRLALARANEAYFHAFGFDLDLKDRGNNGHFAPFAWAG